jgi:hypothetical protein
MEQRMLQQEKDHGHEAEHGHEHGHQIHYYVNNIHYKTHDHELSAEMILRLAGFSSADYTLVQEANPSQPIPPESMVRIHEGEHFLALRKTNPVSEISGMKDIESFFTEKLGLSVDYLKGNNGDNLVVHNVAIPAGPLAGKVCDIALQCTDSNPFLPHPAFHTKPPLAATGTNGTQAGQITPEWQYWSRQWPKPPLSADEVWAWVLTALTQATV